MKCYESVVENVFTLSSMDRDLVCAVKRESTCGVDGGGMNRGSLYERVHASVSLFLVSRLSSPYVSHLACAQHNERA